jgi:hypothetical protein
VVGVDGRRIPLRHGLATVLESPALGLAGAHALPKPLGFRVQALTSISPVGVPSVVGGGGECISSSSVAASLLRTIVP